MTTISIEDAQAKLADLIRGLLPGDELIITDGSHPVARLTTTNGTHVSIARKPGTLRGTVTHIAPDFDAPLDDFKDFLFGIE